MDQRRNNKSEQNSKKWNNNKNSKNFRRIVSSEESTNKSNNPNKMYVFHFWCKNLHCSHLLNKNILIQSLSQQKLDFSFLNLCPILAITNFINFANVFLHLISSTNNWRRGYTVDKSQPRRVQQNWRCGKKSEIKAENSEEVSITLKLHLLKQESIAYFGQIQNKFRVCEMFVMFSIRLTQ